VAVLQEDNEKWEENVHIRRMMDMLVKKGDGNAGKEG
jgi:hypothetical protein